MGVSFHSEKVIVIVISNFLKCYPKAKCRTAANSKRCCVKSKGLSREIPSPADTKTGNRRQ